MENHTVAYCGLYCGACKSLIKGKCDRIKTVGTAEFVAQMKLAAKMSIKK